MYMPPFSVDTDCRRLLPPEDVSKPFIGRARFDWKTRAGPSGVHLFDRNTGTNILLNEIPVAPAQWAAAPRHVSVALTNACDLACPYCFAPKNCASLGFRRLTNWLDEARRKWVPGCRVWRRGADSLPAVCRGVPLCCLQYRLGRLFYYQCTSP